MASEAISLALFPPPNRQERNAFLRCLYDITHGSAKHLVYVEEVAKAMRLDEADVESVIDVLVAEDLIRLRLQCILSITQSGIDAVRTALRPQQLPAKQPVATVAPEPVVHASLSHSLLGADGLLEAGPELPPEPPLPTFTGQERDDLELKLICEAIGLDPKELDGRPSMADVSWQGNHAPGNAVPSKQTLALQNGNVAKTLTSLMLHLPKLGLVGDDLAEAEAEIATATAQLLSPRPKQSIIAASLTTLLSLLDGAGPAAMTIDLHVSLTEIRLFLADLQV